MTRIVNRVPTLRTPESPESAYTFGGALTPESMSANLSEQIQDFLDRVRMATELGVYRPVVHISGASPFWFRGGAQ